MSSEQTAIASRYDRDVIALTTIATVANTYFQVLESQDRLRIARDNLAAATRVLGLIRQRFLVGTASQLDIAQQESLVATQRAAIPPLEITLRQSIAALAVLIGRAPENVSVRGGGMAAIRVPPVTPGLPSDILNQRPDVREAEAQLAVGQLQRRGGARCVLPEHSVDRPERLSERGARRRCLDRVPGTTPWPRLWRSRCSTGFCGSANSNCRRGGSRNCCRPTARRCFPPSATSNRR